MENFIVSARKYRPARFEDVIGQPQVTNTLKNAIRTGQLAQAFLFCGPRGVGKTTCARILAKAVNCEQITADFEPCNTCAACEAFNHNASFNIHELDAASNNSVEDIRTLIEQVRFAPQTGKKKIYIIDEVHMLSQAAFNAFLKTLEEPPPYAIFILATTEKHKIIPTILSRCQIFDFNRIKTEDMVLHLQGIAKKENIEAEADALHIIAQKADGALRDALSMFDRISIFANHKIEYATVVENLNVLDYDYFFKLTDAFLAADTSVSLLTFNTILQKGFDGENFLSGLSDHFRDLLVAKDDSTQVLMDFSEGIRKRYTQQAAYTPASFLVSGLALLNESEFQYKASKNKRLCVELVLIKLCHLPHAIELSKEPVSGLKKKSLKEGEPISPARTEKSADLPVVTKEPVIQSTTGSTTTTQAEEKSAPRKTAGRGAGVRLTSLDSLKKELLEKPTEEVVQDQLQKTDEAVFDEIDKYAFQQVWKSYLKIIEEEKKQVILKILEAFPPEIVGNKTVLIRVGTESYLSTLNGEREEMYYFLKKELDKKAIDLVIQVDKQKSRAESSRKPYTTGEKFNHMVQKNPKLQELKDRLKLELDY
ncbi:MAG: DNA polymerase III subunit gamma/tau [Chitinophagaceae bacterium]|nr:DNA polymerase III subunit gamma/tau [Chitinophagaceae bacterium]